MVGVLVQRAPLRHPQSVAGAGADALIFFFKAATDLLTFAQAA